jgi:hypothetical protein
MGTFDEQRVKKFLVNHQFADSKVRGLHFNFIMICCHKQINIHTPFSSHKYAQLVPKGRTETSNGTPERKKTLYNL